MKSLNQYINEAISDKDYKRVLDIYNKSNGDNHKAYKLARTMADKIKDVKKAESRYEASLQIFGEWDVSSVTRVFRNRAIELGAQIDTTIKTKKQTEAGDKLDELTTAAKEAFSKFKIPSSLFNEGEIYTDYSSYNSKDVSIRFNNPWALYFWNHGMLGQISDGYWENSKTFKDSWKYYFQLTPIYDSKAKYYEWERGQHPNPLYVTKYALQSNDEIVKFGKVYQLRSKELLHLIHDYTVKADDLLINKVKTVEKAQVIAQRLKLDYNTYLALLGCPELPEKDVKKIVRTAFKDMQGPISTPSKL